MQVDLQKILSVSGHPGLFNYVSQARQGIIVESLTDKKRTCLPASARINSLGDISVYTDDEDILLREILVKMRDKHEGKVSISHKASSNELIDYFKEVLPDYDEDRFLPSHMKKIVSWYNILCDNDMLEFKEFEKDDEESESTDQE